MGLAPILGGGAIAAAIVVTIKETRDGGYENARLTVVNDPRTGRDSDVVAGARVLKSQGILGDATKKAAAIPGANLIIFDDRRTERNSDDMFEVYPLTGGRHLASILREDLKDGHAELVDSDVADMDRSYGPAAYVETDGKAHRVVPTVYGAALGADLFRQE